MLKNKWCCTRRFIDCRKLDCRLDKQLCKFVALFYQNNADEMESAYFYLVVFLLEQMFLLFPALCWQFSVHLWRQNSGTIVLAARQKSTFGWCFDDEIDS